MPTPPSETPPAQTRLAGEMELARLVDLAAARLGLSVEYDAGSLKGRVTVRLTDQVSDVELWDLMNRLLAARGFTTVRMAGSDVISVAKIDQASKIAAIEHAGDSGPDPRAPRPGFTVTVFRPRFADPASIVELVQATLSKPGGSISELGQTGQLLIADLTPRVDQAMRLVEALDREDRAVVVETVPAQNVGAERLAGLATTVAAKRQAAGSRKLGGEVLASPDGRGVLVIAPARQQSAWRSLVEELDRQEAVVTREYTPTVFDVSDVAQLIEEIMRPVGAALDERQRITTDVLTGSLIVTATPTQHGRIAEVMERLESTPDRAGQAMRRVFIRNRDAKELLQVLTDLLDEGVLGARTIETTWPGGAAESAAAGTGEAGTAVPGGPAAASRRGPRDGGAARAGGMTLRVDPSTNSIIALGEPRMLTRLEALIRDLDVRQPQVVIEVMLLSLSQTQARTLGVELERLEVHGGTFFKLASLFGLSSAAAGASGPTSIGRSVSNAAGFTGLVLDPGEFSVVVRALETLSGGRALTIPKVLVTNNESAAFDSVLQQPVTSVNASSTVTTTSFGGFQDAGTQITVTPTIFSGDNLLLDYNISLSTFVGDAAGPGVPPPRQQNNLSSIATIPDGFTVVVGGLESVTNTTGESRVPFVGALPVIGEAFKSRSRSRGRSRFFVFIRATVLRDGLLNDLKYLSERDVHYLDRSDGIELPGRWPEVRPRLIGVPMGSDEFVGSGASR